MLPLTSSWKSRRSNEKEAPNSNNAASGSPAKRPDQRCAISAFHDGWRCRVLARRRLGGKTPNLDEALRGRVLESITGVIRRKFAIVEGAIRATANHAAISLEEFETHGAGHARLNRGH